MPTVTEIKTGKTGAVKFNAEIVDLVARYMEANPGEHGDNTTKLFAHLLKEATTTAFKTSVPSTENTDGLQAKITELQTQLNEQRAKTWDAMKRTMEVYHNPLCMLSEEEYQTVIKWDKEVFEPAMEHLTGEKKVLFNARQKFLMMLNYSTADPVGTILNLLKHDGIKLSEATENAIVDLQFPRSNDLKAVFAEWKEAQARIVELQNNPANLGKNIIKYLQGHDQLIYAKMNNADVIQLLQQAEKENTADNTTTGGTTNADTGAVTGENTATQ